MSTPLFRRKWRVTVGTLQTEDVDVEFNIRRTLNGRFGTCELTLYNLTSEHRREIEQAHRPMVRVEAGYETSMSVLFQGNERKTVNSRSKTEWTTKITAGDGENSIRTARASRSFGPDARLSDVLAYLGQSLGIGLGNLPETVRGRTLDRVSETFPHGTVVHGNAQRELSRLLHSAGLSWSVQGGVLQVLPLGGALSREAILLSSSTGLVESPEVGKNRTVKAKALLISDLVPGQRVQLQSDVVSGLYRVESGEYVGDSKGNDWYAELELRELR